MSRIQSNSGGSRPSQAPSPHSNTATDPRNAAELSNEASGRHYFSASPQFSAHIFRREGEYWTIVYAGVVCRLRDAKGLRCLAILLTNPGVRIAALALLVGTRLRAGTETRGSTNCAAEQARVNVTRAIKTVLQRIREHHPLLSDHLETTIHTGTFCSYTPDPRVSIHWDT
jgi:hypothetical protein